jgi:hypothetical protein
MFVVAILLLGLLSAGVLFWRRHRDRPFEERILPTSLQGLVRANKIRVPTVRRAQPLPAGSWPVVVIGANQIALGGTPLMEVPERSEAEANGLPARYKHDGKNSLLLQPLALALEADRAQRRPDGGEAPRDLLVLADKSTPGRLIMEVLYTAGLSGYESRFVVTAGGQLQQVAVEPPRLPAEPSVLRDARLARLRAEVAKLERAEPVRREGAAPGAHSVSMTPSERSLQQQVEADMKALSRATGPAQQEPILVQLSDYRVKGQREISIQVAGESVARGCERLGPGPAIADHDGWDGDALSRCLQGLRQRLPSLAEEKTVRWGIGPHIDHGDHLRLREAMLSTPDGASLFERID